MTTFLAWATFFPAIAGAGEPAENPLSFVRKFHPILDQHCYARHGPDEAQRKAKLRLDTQQDALHEHAGGTPFAAGSADDSEVFQRITSTDPADRMPAGKAAVHPPPEQVAVIKRWIEEGAKWESRWAFAPPVKQDFPPSDNPAWPGSRAMPRFRPV